MAFRYRIDKEKFTKKIDRQRRELSILSSAFTKKN